MNNNFSITDDLLWDYSDGLLAQAERLQVETYLQKHPEAFQRLRAIEAEKRMLAGLALEKPDTDFSKRVMTAWLATQAQPVAAKRDWILFSIMGVLAFLIAVALVLIVGTAPELAPVEIPEKLLPQMPAIDWAFVFDSAMVRYGFIITLALLSLQFLDKYLQQRTKWQGLVSL
jgi:anti-sigma factor RsiW